MEMQLVLAFLVLALGVTLGSCSGQAVEEELFIVHLPDSRTMAHFQFSITWDMHPLILAQNFKGQLEFCYGCSQGGVVFFLYWSGW